MVTALKEILELKPNISGFNKKNTNPYCILTKEGDLSTAYCFSVPIYNRETGQLVRREFISDGGAIRFSGSNAKGYIRQGNLILSNKNGNAVISIPSQKPRIKWGKVTIGSWSITPSFNGIHVCANTSIVKFTIQTSREFSPQCSAKSFELMQERFLPFLTVSPLLGRTADGEVIPCVISCQRESNLLFTLTIEAPKMNSLEFELNLYQPKLFQDTTVECLHPTENNAFGGISFLGSTMQTGEQWLYSRLDTAKISEFYCTAIKKMLLHLPRWNCSESEIEISAPLKRFCSFGSNWENKVPHTASVLTAVSNGSYLTIDATQLLTSTRNQTLQQTEGFMLRTRDSTAPAVAISTGDNYTCPQILEIQYKY